MAELCRISIPVDPAILSPNRIMSRNWRERLKLKRKAWMDARLAWQEAGRPVASGPIIYHLIVRRCAQMDDDNIVGGLKHSRDGLFVNAITPDDSRKYVTIGHIEQEISHKYKLKPEVVFIVEDLNG